MRRITINLLDDERQALNSLAKQQKRDIRAQAAYLIRFELERLGLLTGDATLTLQEESTKGSSQDE